MARRATPAAETAKTLRLHALSAFSHFKLMPRAVRGAVLSRSPKYMRGANECCEVGAIGLPTALPFIVKHDEHDRARRQNARLPQLLPRSFQAHPPFVDLCAHCCIVLGVPCRFFLVDSRWRCCYRRVTRFVDRTAAAASPCVLHFCRRPTKVPTVEIKQILTPQVPTVAAGQIVTRIMMPKCPSPLEQILTQILTPDTPRRHWNRYLTPIFAIRTDTDVTCACALRRTCRPRAAAASVYRLPPLPLPRQPWGSCASRA